MDPVIAVVTPPDVATDNGHPAVDDESSSPLLAALSKQIEQSLLSITAPHPSLTPELILSATQAALDSLLAAYYAHSAAPTSASLTTTASSSSSSLSPPPRRIRTYIDGCFDIMHSGHYNAIRQAKALTDVLVVGVHSDAEILKHKGPPVMNNDERMATVQACKWVDEVVFDTPYDPSLALLDRLHCDYCVHGDDMSTTADGRDAYEEVKKAGRMKIVKRTEGISTTDLVGRLLLMTKQHHIAVPLSPSLSPRLMPARAATSSQTINTSPTHHTAAVPSFLLDAIHSPASPGIGRAALTPSVPARKLSLPSAATVPAAVTSTTPTAATPAVAASTAVTTDAVDSVFASKGISNFLPTTWRIAQFSNNRVPSASDVVVYIDGAFDLFHVGHIETLRKAKALGSFLYVGLHDDITVNAHRGRNYPIMNLHERCMNVLSCKFVDEVVIGAPWACSRDLITTLGIHIVATGSNSKFPPGEDKEGRVDPYREAKALGMYREIDTSYLLETEDVVQRIVENRIKFEKRNEKRSAKEKSYLTTQKEYVREV